ncbi:MAG TPA: hypothetical protein VKD71_02225, partial [Gemmataceae bacterium]|nr:hypothetical protein [Gemmataceae bacterium]
EAAKQFRDRFTFTDHALELEFQDKARLTEFLAKARLQRIRRVGLIPLDITERAVDRRDVLPGQPQPGLHLGPMVAGVQHPPPEHPYPLSP